MGLNWKVLKLDRKLKKKFVSGGNIAICVFAGILKLLGLASYKPIHIFNSSQEMKGKEKFSPFAPPK